MNVERLRKIIAYSESNHEEINSKVKWFCSFTGSPYDSDLLNILQFVRSSFQKKGFFVLEMPFADDKSYFARDIRKYNCNGNNSV